MWWRDFALRRRRLAVLGRAGLVLAAASVTAGCFQPLYATRSSPGSESVRDRLASIQVAPPTAGNGSPEQRIAIGVHNAVIFDLTGGSGAVAPTHRLVINVVTTQLTIAVDPTSGRPTANIDSVAANYQLVEVATGKTVVDDVAAARVDYDIPGPEQRFAAQRAQRGAEDRAVQVIAESIRNRLASYFVAGT